MRKMTIVMITAIVMMAMTTSSFAQMSKSTAKKAAPQAKVESMTGTVTAIDVKSNMFTIQDAAGAQKTFSVDAKTLASLQSGAQVKVSTQQGKVKRITTMKK